MAVAVTVETDELAGCTVARLLGDLEYESAPIVDEALGRIVDGAGSPRIVVDLSRVGFCDSTGLGVLVRAFKKATAAGGSLCLASADGMIGQLLEITQLGRVLDTYPSVPDGCQAMSAATG